MKLRPREAVRVGDLLLQSEELELVPCSDLILDGYEVFGRRLKTVVLGLQPIVEGKRELVEQMGFEPTTPTLRTWCSPN